MRRWLAAAALLAAACTSSRSATHPTTAGPDPSSHSKGSSSSSSSAPTRSNRPFSTSGTSSSPASPAERALAGMSLRERVGQLLMVDCQTSGIGYATAQALTAYHVGSVILDTTSYAGRGPIAALTAALQRLAPRHRRLLISTDQEGGLVQRLQGPGFSRIPAATVQGRYATSILYTDARQWGRQLHAAGVNVNLAPVLDVVPSGFGSNPPIGDLDREYGHTPGAVAQWGLVVARGFRAAGVAPTVKHFPGLGRVHGNTDLSSGVTDHVTTRDDPYLGPFKAAVRAGMPIVMISTAIYSRIDPGVPAAFSRKIITGLLRQHIGFHGLVISDDLGGARQVAGVSVGARAVRFVAAGGDVVLTVNAAQAQPMTAALVAAARKSSTFRAKVNAAALRVLQEKQRLGLLA